MRMILRRAVGTNSAALGRLRNFVKGHECVASFAEDTVIFRRSVQAPRRRDTLTHLADLHQDGQRADYLERPPRLPVAVSGSQAALPRSGA